MQPIWKICVAAVLMQTAIAASAEDWRSRSIYQLLTDRFAREDRNLTAHCWTEERTFCGGTWRGIIGELDYIQGMGFSAIWISPITYNIQGKTEYGDAWHGYWQQNIYRLNDHFGTADDLKALSKALNDRNMYLMADVVINHNGWNGSMIHVDYSQFHPFDKAEYFHNDCTIDYSDQRSIEDCWLGDNKVALADLDTENPLVHNEYHKWIKELVSNYSIDGLRIDTARHVPQTFWASFTTAASVFATGEVSSPNASYVCSYQDHMPSILNYPTYYDFRTFLSSPSGSSAPLLSTLDAIRSACKDRSVLGIFSENHDVPRFASETKDLALAKNLLVLTMSWDGIPIVYAGQEQHYAGGGDPFNREATWYSGYNTTSELYLLTKKMNQVRNLAIAKDKKYMTYDSYALWKRNDTVVLRKGNDGNQVVVVVSNRGTNGTAETIAVEDSGWTAGTKVVDVLTCEQVVVGNKGQVEVQISGGAPRVYFGMEAGGDVMCKGA